ncbi:hypothetical protein KDA_40770 [Dictyobacter alpinus]|uniref:Photosynthesis system II assembly factor Ycf48/Hcf136-like domain-containing protein n=1 Tax=Dictyobacter alpinus TaxID=2014873 RepID=A0A402BB13_9CHLR|nr:hypothetical protein [Dictyobacter alpinus]GCE28593.1 hypothetical protein KDA_40770 [Dictyobacter alpinus]
MKTYQTPVRVAWLPFCLLTLVLALLLAACGNASTDTGTAPSVPSADASSTATPGSTPVAQNTPTATSVANTGTSKPTLPLTAIRMVDKNNGWALTASSILKTVDAGAHWKDVTPANAGLNQSAKGDFLSGQYAWIAVPPANQQGGAGIAILRTSDGGSNWQSSKINDPLVSIPDVPHFLNGQEGWLEASSTPGAGHAGSDIWHSSDGGQSWSKIASNAQNNGLRLGHVTGISFKDALTGIATGDLGAGADNSFPSIALTHDGGHNWKIISLPHVLGGFEVSTSATLPPVFIGNVVLLPVRFTTRDNRDFGMLYRSTNGGNNWFPTNAVENLLATTMYVQDANHIWATNSQNGKVYRSVDGGNNWSATSNSAYSMAAFSFIDASNGWGISSKQLLQPAAPGTVATDQKLMRTTDGGATWQQINYTISS